MENFYKVINAREANEEEKSFLSKHINNTVDVELEDKTIVVVEMNNNDDNIYTDLVLFSGKYGAEPVKTVKKKNKKKNIKWIYFLIHNHLYDKHRKYFLSTQTPYYKADIVRNKDNKFDHLYNIDTKTRLIFEFYLDD